MTTVEVGRAPRGAARGLALAAVVTVAALLIRMPRLQEIPLVTDETAEVATSLEILAGDRPLIHSEAYRGPGWAYLLAGFMRLSGGSPASPRAFAAILGALTAGAACLLAIELSGGKLIAGAVAGAGVATATGLTTLASHVAWSNNATPLWVVLGALCLVRASQAVVERRHNGGANLAWWAASGAFWGLALHSHPSAVAPMTGAAVWWLSATDRRRSLKTVGPWTGGLALIVVLLPLIVHNIARPMDSLRAATVNDQPVARDFSGVRLLSGGAGLARQVARISGVGSGISDAPPGPSSPSLDGAVWWQAVDNAVRAARPAAAAAYAGLILGALTLALVREPRLIGSMAASGALLLVLVNTSWDNFYDSRYVAFLAVLGWVAVGVHAAALLGSASLGARTPLRLAITTALAILIAYPLLVTSGVYRAEAAAGRTNTAFLADADRLSEAARRTGAPILVDEALRSIEMGGGGNGERALVYLSRLRGAAAEATDETEMRWFLDQPDARVILVTHPDTALRLDAPWRDGASSEWRIAFIGVPESGPEPADDP